MDFHGFIKIGKEFIYLYGYKSILLFPKGGRTKFPYGEGVVPVNEEKIIQNIKLEKGLYKKKLSRYNYLKHQQEKYPF